MEIADLAIVNEKVIPNRRDMRTPALFFGDDLPKALDWFDYQGEIVGLLIGLARGHIRDTDQLRAQAILEEMGL